MKTHLNRIAQRGLTIVELLVVVTIIGILAALSAAAVARGKAAAQRIECMNKLRQWGQGAQLYAEDHNDKLPQEAVFDGINTWEMTTFSVCSEVWYNSMPKSLGVTPAATYSRTPSSQRTFYSKRSFFHCPTARFAPVSATYPNFSLAMNSKLMMDFEAAPDPILDTEIGFRNLRTTQIVMPEKTALFLDAGVAGEKRVSEFQPPTRGNRRHTLLNSRRGIMVAGTFFSRLEMFRLCRRERWWIWIRTVRGVVAEFFLRRR